MTFPEEEPEAGEVGAEAGAVDEVFTTTDGESVVGFGVETGFTLVAANIPPGPLEAETETEVGLAAFEMLVIALVTVAKVVATPPLPASTHSAILAEDISQRLLHTSKLTQSVAYFPSEPATPDVYTQSAVLRPWQLHFPGVQDSAETRRRAPKKRAAVVSLPYMIDIDWRDC